jgi:hypothetical protein
LLFNKKKFFSKKDLLLIRPGSILLVGGGAMKTTIVSDFLETEIEKTSDGAIRVRPRDRGELERLGFEIVREGVNASGAAVRVYKRRAQR